MADFVGLSIAGVKEIAEKLDQLSPAAQDAGVENVDMYLVNALRQYPPYSSVPISAVGGFVSDKQRRKVMAMISAGEITPGSSNRSQRLSGGWTTLGEGRDQIVVNEVEYAPYVVSIEKQTQMHMLQGWQVVPEFLQNRMDEIVRRFDAGVKYAIHKLGLD